MIALLNAYVQVGIWFLLFVFTIITLGFSSMIELAPDHPKSSLFSLAFDYPLFVLPILSVALIPARDSRKWQVIALIATLLNAGLVFLSALLVDVTFFFVPMVGYLVSTFLVGLALNKASEHLRGFHLTLNLQIRA